MATWGKMTGWDITVSRILSHSVILNSPRPAQRTGPNQLRWPFLALQVITYCILKDQHEYLTSFWYVCYKT